MRRFMHWLATAATLSFIVPVQAGQNDPRLDNLFDELRRAPSEEEARPVESAIWQIWLMAGNGAVDAEMLRGIAAMSNGDEEGALAAFTRVTEMQPDLAEGWNKRATINFLLGRYDASVVDIEKTLKLEPRHFGALSGLGLINLTLGRDLQALAAFEAALRIHPHLPGADGHIRELREKVRGKKI